MTTDSTEKKYELTEETIVVGDHTLHRIRALRDFAYVKAGDIGGYVESEDNLSHKGDCWIFGKACVYEEARVSGDASVHDYVQIFGNAKVHGLSMVVGCSKISGGSIVYGSARIFGNAIIG